VLKKKYGTATGADGLRTVTAISRKYYQTVFDYIIRILYIYIIRFYLQLWYYCYYTRYAHFTIVLEIILTSRCIKVVLVDDIWCRHIAHCCCKNAGCPQIRKFLIVIIALHIIIIIFFNTSHAGADCDANTLNTVVSQNIKIYITVVVL